MPRSPIRLFCALLSLGLLPAAPTNAQAQQKFPYQAVVIGDNVEVRSGPGSRYYVTSVAARNEPVVVRRHDHGGWYMVEPPRGNFSLIEASQVKKLSGDRGIVQPTSDPTARVKVRVGSLLTGDHSIYARELSQGDEVLILGEQIVQSETGAVPMLKIAPPAQEFRWIKGEFLAPTNSQVKQLANVDPYQIPVEHRERLITQGLLPVHHETPALTESPVQVAASEPPVKPSAPVISLNSAFEQLTEVDRRYREMAALPPEQWQLDEIEADYQRLKRDGNPTIAALVDQRLPGLAQRQKVASHTRNISQTIAAASQRDAELLAQAGNPVATAMNIPATNPYAGSAAAPQLAMSVPGPVFNATQGLAGPVPTPLVENGPQPAPSATADPVTPQLSGAGIVTQVSGPPGMPAYALIAPGGKFLAFLEPAGPQADLKNWIGREAGLVGQRKKNPSLDSDVITVQKILPVSLTK